MHNPTITLIVAAAENNAIGKGNKMPWHLPNDFKYFKKNTLEHHIVMGRKTFESIGKALPGRRNIILTRDPDFRADGIETCSTIEQVLAQSQDENEIFIIGGAQIYAQTIAIADKVLLTRVHTTLDGDAFFQKLNPSEWALKSQDKHEKDEKHAYDYTFEVWERISAYIKVNC